MSYVKLEDVKKAFPFLKKHKMYVLEKWWVDRMLDLEVPKADVVEVKHGYWKQGKNNFVYNIFDCFVCSKCGTAFPYRSPYCGECGAKMDEVEDE